MTSAPGKDAGPPQRLSCSVAQARCGDCYTDTGKIIWAEFLVAQIGAPRPRVYGTRGRLSVRGRRRPCTRQRVMSTKTMGRLATVLNAASFRPHQ